MFVNLVLLETQLARVVSRAPAENSRVLCTSDPPQATIPGRVGKGHLTTVSRKFLLVNRPYYPVVKTYINGSCVPAIAVREGDPQAA